MAGLILPNICHNADANGFRIIEIVRPGCGSSTPISDRSINSISQINLEIADAFGIENFAILGGSGGGHHALASGRLAGSQCIAQLKVTRVAPFDDPNFDFLAGMAEEHREARLLSLTCREEFEDSISKKATEWSSPVQLWIGTKDVNFPPAHADYLKRIILNSDLFIVEDKNHLTISEPAIKEGFKWLRGFFASPG